MISVCVCVYVFLMRFIFYSDIVKIMVAVVIVGECKFIQNFMSVRDQREGDGYVPFSYHNVYSFLVE